MNKTTKTDLSIVQPSDSVTSPSDTAKYSVKFREPTKKEKELARVYATDKTISKVDAFKQVYDTKTENRESLYSMSKQVFRKPTVISELAKYNNRIEEVLINTVDEWGDHEKPRQREIALNTAQFIHDKIHGRSKQQIEMSKSSVTLSINLTGNVTPEDTDTV